MGLKERLKKKLLIFFVLTAFIFSFSYISQSVNATELPKGVVEYLQKSYPGVNVRFDGLVELPDGTLYLPVLPISYPDTTDQLRIVMTMPENSERPDLIIFSNNLSFLRLIEGEAGTRTLISGPEVPLKVKLGLLPQDLIVPDNLVIPADLRSILGDLVIKTDAKTPFNQTQTTNIDSLASGPTHVATQTEKTIDTGDSQPTDRADQLQSSTENSKNLPSLNDQGTFGISGRMLYVTGIGGNQLYIVDPKSSEIKSTVKIGALPYKSVLSHDGDHLYIICLTGNTLASINTRTNKLENLIKVGLRPTSIDLSPDGSKLFVANSGSGTVNVINTELFEIVSNIEVQGMPEALVASNDNRSFYLINRSSGIISKWDGLNPENRQFLFVLKNPYAMALSPDETRLYVTSRTENSLMVYSITDKKYESVVNVGEKPVDVDISSDGRYVYTLDAGEDKISIINTETFEIENTIDLRTGGFPSTLTIIPGTHNALVTNAESDKLSLVDLESRQVLTDLPIGITSKSLTIGPGPKLQQEQVKEPSQ